MQKERRKNKGAGGLILAALFVAWVTGSVPSRSPASLEDYTIVRTEGHVSAVERHFRLDFSECVKTYRIDTNPADPYRVVSASCRVVFEDENPWDQSPKGFKPIELPLRLAIGQPSEITGRVLIQGLSNGYRISVEHRNPYANYDLAVVGQAIRDAISAVPGGEIRVAVFTAPWGALSVESPRATDPLPTLP